MDGRAFVAPSRIFAFPSRDELFRFQVKIVTLLHALIGRRETGKTTLAMNQARQPHIRQRLIFDIRNNIAPRGDGIKVFSAEELIETGYPLLLQDEVSEVIYVPKDGIVYGFSAWSTVVQEYVELFRSRRAAVVIDEAGILDKQIEPMDHPIQLAMRNCRRDRTDFYFTCHQPKHIPTNTRAISDFLIFFHCSQEHDLRVIAERTSDAFAAKVARLAPYHFLIWNDFKGEPVAVAVEPHAWHVDLEARPAEPAPARSRGIDVGNLWL
jgi:hypothetical protein